MNSTKTFRISFFCKIAAISIIGGFVLFSVPTYAQEQGKSKLEKLNQKKNKRNRRSNRRGDKAKSNTRQKRVVRSQVRSRQGDKAHEGDITGRPVRTKVSPRPSHANYAKPNPYAGVKRKSEASAAKAAARYGRRSPASATKRGEVAFRTLPNGRKPRIRSATAASARARTYPRPSPYRRTVRTEDDMSRSAAKLRRRPVSATRKGEVARTTTASGQKFRPPRSASNRTARITPKRVSPYRGIKRITENDKARSAAKLRRRPATATTKGEIAHTTTINGRKFKPPRSITKTTKSPPAPRVNPYFGKAARSEDEMSRSAAKLRSRPSTATRKGETGSNKTSAGVEIPRASGTQQVATGGIRFRKKRKTPYGPMRRVKPWESGHPKDITGRKFRPKAPSNLPVPRKPLWDPYHHRKKVGDKPSLKNRTAFISPPSLSKPTEKGWKGSISGKKLTTKTSPRPQVNPRNNFNPYYGRKKTGDNAYRGRISANRRSATRAGESKPGISIGNTGRTLSITQQFKGQRQQRVDPYYGKRRKGTETPSPRQARNNSVTSQFKGPGKPLNPTRNLSITRQFKGPGRPLNPTRNLSITRQFKGPGKPLNPTRNLSITHQFKGPGRPLNPTRDLSITEQFKGPGQNTFDPYKGRKKGGDIPYTGRIRPNKSSITKSSEEGATRNRFVGTRTLSITSDIKAVKKRKEVIGYRTVNTQWNNNGNPLIRQQPGKTALIASSFQGRTKSRKPLTGGGSVSRNDWNNDGQPILVRQAGKGTAVAMSFSGRTKAKKPELGGGSVSRSGWNNDAQALNVKPRGKNIAVATAFSGRQRAQQPLTGSGGSITRDNWNNKGDAIEVVKITPQIYDAARFKGRFKKSNMVPRLNDDYINYSGDDRVTRRPNKFYHPSYYMHKQKDTDSVEEKEKKISIRLLWSKVFKSSNPGKNRKRPNDLQFDPREEGLWYN